MSTPVQYDVCVLESGSFLCPRTEISLRNHRILFWDVARDFDDFHTVKVWCTKRVEYIGYEAYKHQSDDRRNKGEPVQTKRMRERSTGSSMLCIWVSTSPRMGARDPLVTKYVVYSGSSISRGALAESPLVPRLTLSTSSIRTSGFSVPTRSRA